MKHRLFYTLGPIVLIMVAFTISPAQVQQAQPVQQVQPVQLAVPYKQPLKIFKAVTLDEARKALLAQPPQMFDSGFVSKSGPSNSSYNLQTGEIWLTIMNDGNVSNPNQYVYTAFNASGLQNTGSASWKGVTVTATAQVIYLLGVYPLALKVGYYLNGTYYDSGRIYMRSPGQYILTTGAFDITPGSTLQGWACMLTTAEKNNGTCAYGKILSIKPNL